MKKIYKTLPTAFLVLNTMLSAGYGEANYNASSTNALEKRAVFMVFPGAMENIDGEARYGSQAVMEFFSLFGQGSGVTFLNIEGQEVICSDFNSLSSFADASERLSRLAWVSQANGYITNMKYAKSCESLKTTFADQELGAIANEDGIETLTCQSFDSSTQLRSTLRFYEHIEMGQLVTRVRLERSQPENQFEPIENIIDSYEISRIGTIQYISKDFELTLTYLQERLKVRDPNIGTLVCEAIL